MDNHISSRALLHRRDVIKNNPRFSEAIIEHYRINDAIYKKQPLFYKTMLQESRFNIILSICCFVFGNQAESVSEIKALCSRYNIASPNSVIAIITILKTTGRIKTGAVPKIGEKQKSRLRKKDWMSLNAICPGRSRLLAFFIRYSTLMLIFWTMTHSGTTFSGAPQNTFSAD